MSAAILPASRRFDDGTRTRPFAWTFLPFIERKCHKGRFDQILCRKTQSGRRDEACTNIYANTVIANNLWRVLRSAISPTANQLFGVAIARGNGATDRHTRP